MDNRHIYVTGWSRHEIIANIYEFTEWIKKFVGIKLRHVMPRQREKGYISVSVRVSAFSYLPIVRVLYSGRVDGDLSTEGYSLVDLRQK